ncbi:MAG TPA: hypothetical protein VGR87_13490 [Candidatus Limnocylindria bacterium]|jgi:hypothetical protein|nr:hypothetical protein [Candidatus Limnocylindria bacterium]
MAPASRALTAALATNAYPLAIASAVFILAVGLPSTDSDTYWHLATGRWMLEHRELLRQDIFSSTVAGTHFGIGEWLGQLAFAAAFATGGWAGIAILRASLIAVGSFFLARLARRGGTPWWISLPMIAAALLVSKITWTDRPHLFTLAFLPLLLDLLLPLPPGPSRRLLALPPLFLLWANLHGGYLLGLAVLAAFAAHALIADGRRGLPLAVAAAAAVALTFLNPAPVELAGAAREDVLHPPRFLTEFLPPDVLTPAGALFAAFVLAVVGSALLRGGTLLEAMLLTPLLYLALTAQRHMIFFCFAAAAFLGPRLLSLVPAPARVAELPARLRVPTALALLIAAVLSAAGAPAVPDERAYPKGALAALRGGSGVLLNEYDWGGFLIFGLPERPVFIDGRYVPYLAGVLDDYRSLVGLRPGWRDLLERYKVAEILLAPQRPLVVALREDGWRVGAQDAAGKWIVLRRP